MERFTLLLVLGCYTYIAHLLIEPFVYHALVWLTYHAPWAWFPVLASGPKLSGNLLSHGIGYILAILSEALLLAVVLKIR